MSDEFNHIEKIAGLIEKNLWNDISEPEYRELMEWCNLSKRNKSLFNKLSNHNYLNDKKQYPDIQALQKGSWEKVINAITAENKSVYPVVVRRVRCIPYFIVAFVAGLLLANACLYPKIKPVIKSYVSAAITANFKNDVVPGGNKAMLILSNGSHVVLDSTGKGVIADQGKDWRMELQGEVYFEIAPDT